MLASSKNQIYPATQNHENSTKYINVPKTSNKTDSTLKDMHAITTKSSSARQHKNGNSNSNMNANSNDKRQEVNVSEFIAEDKQQQYQQQQSNLNDKDTDQLLTNISQIIHCKKQAESLMSQIQLYIRTIHRLRRQATQYQDTLSSKQQQCKQLRDLLHCRDLEILTLKEDKDRIMRSNCVNLAKMQVLRDLNREDAESKWQHIMDEQLREQGQEQEQYWERQEQTIGSRSRDRSITMDEYSIAMSMSMNRYTDTKQNNDSLLKTMQTKNRPMSNKNRHLYNPQLANPQFYCNSDSSDKHSNTNINIGRLLRQQNSNNNKQTNNSSLAHQMYGRIIKSGNSKYNNKNGEQPMRQRYQKKKQHQDQYQYQYKWNEQSTFV